MIWAKEFEGIVRQLETMQLGNGSLLVRRDGNSDGPELIMVYQREYDGHRMIYRARIDRDTENGGYSLAGYHAILRNIPDVQHNVFEGIDTHQLEQRLEKINWVKGAPVAGTDAAAVVDELLFLSRLYNKRANEAADQLMLRYWADTPMEDHIRLHQDRSQYEKQAFFPLEKNANDIDGYQAYNLLCGRAVLQMRPSGQSWQPDHWVMLEGGKLVQYPLFDLAAQLRSLPFATPLSDTAGQEIVANLIVGATFLARLQWEEKQEIVRIEADPRAGELSLYKSNGERIPVKTFLSAQSPQKQKDQQSQGRKRRKL